MTISLRTLLSPHSIIRNMDAAADVRTAVSARLATGKRINGATDDAAGLAVAMGLSAETRVYTQAHRNISDGLGMTNVAESALTELSSIVLRQQDLAAQAANGSYSSEQRRALQKESDALTSEYGRIVSTTRFNGLNLLDGSLAGGLVLQAGRPDETLSVTLGDAGIEDVTLRPTGTFGTVVTSSTGYNSDAIALGDFNGDGITDAAVTDNSANFRVLTGTGTGTFIPTSGANATPTHQHSIAGKDVNGDGVLDVVTGDQFSNRVSVFIGNGDGSFRARRLAATRNGPTVGAFGFLNGDSHLDMIIASQSGGADVFLGNGDGTFTARRSISAAGTADTVMPGDLDGNGTLDLVISDTGSGFSVVFGNGDGSFKAKVDYGGLGPSGTTLADMNGDGSLDILAPNFVTGEVRVFTNDGAGGFTQTGSMSAPAPHSVTAGGDLDGDSIPDVLTTDYNSDRVLLFSGNGDGTFRTPRVYTDMSGAGLGDVNGDGIADLFGVKFGTVSVKLAETGAVSRPVHFDLTTTATSRAALDRLGEAQDHIASIRGGIGTLQSRLMTAARTLKASGAAREAALSRIEDADIAEQSALLVASDIRLRVGASLMANVRRGSEVLVELLQG